MKTNSSRPNVYLVSFLTSIVLAIAGLVLLLLQLSAVTTVLGLILLVIGIVQVIADVGWVSMIKINANLTSYKEAFYKVAKQRNQKLFLVPALFDITFVVISILLIVTYSAKL